MAVLALESGAVFRGVGIGALEVGNPVLTATGEVVFNTAMAGYQEALTDPSYAGQILVMTAAQIGNYGINDEDMESARPQVAGFVVRESSRIVSNQRATSALSAWLAKWNIPAIAEIDTRALVRRIRTEGAMRGVLSNDPALSATDLVRSATTAPSMAGANLASAAAPKQAFDAALGGLQGWWPQSAASGDGGGAPRILLIDCGAKHNIIRHLIDRGCQVRCVPDTVTVDEIREWDPDGLFLSNGPGDPAAMGHLVETIREVAGSIPTFGICLGHQILALAMGARTFKLPFGHRGANQPVRDVEAGGVEITSQNHGFCVDEDSLVAAGGVVTHRHLNDGTVAGFRHGSNPIAAVQFHPESSPGPHDSARLFDDFVGRVKAGRGANQRP